MVGKLELKNEGVDGFRHYLDGEPVHCGELLEVLADDGSWVRGRYEWNFRAGGDPCLCIDDDGIFLKERHLLRWPGREEA